ncbi:PKD domain-containing protein, partial [Gordonibacter massiliensis]|nr:PKD domain-containing protein [Gordonibacter massiliensis (ex Traore et al. 2017)]
LKTAYVPAGSYAAYAAALQSSLPAGAEIKTDLMEMAVPNLKVAKRYSKSVVLSWSAHPGSDIVGYEISRDGVLLGTTEDTAFTERGLAVDSKYEYSVCGYTSDGRRTTASTVAVILAAPRIISVTTQNDFDKVGLESNKLCARVIDDGNLEPLGGDEVVGSFYYLDGGERILIGRAKRGPSVAGEAIYTASWDVNAVPDGNYDVVFCLTDVDGSTAERTKMVTVDSTRPAQIINVTALGDSKAIYVSWSISQEVDTTVYRVYRKTEGQATYARIAQLNDRNTLSYIDTDVQEGVRYSYYVVGVDVLDQESVPSVEAHAFLLGDVVAPVVTKLTPEDASYLSGQVLFGVEAQDDVGVSSIQLFYSLDDGVSWTLMAQGDSGKLHVPFNSFIVPDGVLKLKGIAYDAAGNQSDPLIYSYKVDNTGPSQVRGLTYFATSVSVTLAWEDVEDNDISFYRVEQLASDGTYTTVVDASTTLGANIYGLIPQRQYTYRVVGYDRLGNRGIASEDINVTTASDTTAPVVTRLRPTSGYYSNSISLSATGTDEYCVEKMIMQTSQDGKTWKDVYEETFGGVDAQRTVQYDLSLAEYAEGPLYVRALAFDAAGNQSDSSKSAPFVQYFVDRTAPAAPSGVSASGRNGYIEIAWSQGGETDLGTYEVYRSSSENGLYERIAQDLASLNYYDRAVEEGGTYFYKVAVSDAAGNLSDYSSAVSASVLADTEKPKIVSAYPADGQSVGVGRGNVSVLAADNQALDKVTLEYSVDGETFALLCEETRIDASSKVVSAAIPLEQLDHGASIFIRATAVDKAGNVSDSATICYLVDSVAPQVAEASAVFDGTGVCLEWTGCQESDLIGYRIYRKTSDSESEYSLIAQRQVVPDQSVYSCFDSDIPVVAASYRYKVEAVDVCGNVSSVETPVVTIPDRSSPVAVLDCGSVLEVGVEYVFDASRSNDNSLIASYSIDFGDGTSSSSRKSVHSYAQTGEYTVSLTVVDDMGNATSCSKQIIVKDRTLIGTVTVCVVDENGAPVPNAPVYFNLGEEDQEIKSTDSGGSVVFTGEVGRHTVGCVIADNKWLPVKKDIIVTAGEQTKASLTLIRRVMIEGQFEITRMTFEEIVAAGIDVSKPENQYFVQVNMHLVYGDRYVETSFIYNELTGVGFGEPTIVSTGGNGHEEKRQIIPVILDSTPGDYEFSKESPIAILDIPVGVSCLKEFFDVNLHIINNASNDFSMIDNVVSLDVPEGLTLVESYESESNATVAIPEIPGQTTKTISWILRGDQVGEYYLNADYSGVLSEFGAPIHAAFEASEPIKVYGLSDLKLKVEIPEELDHGTFYYNTSLINEGKLDMYRPGIETGDVLIETQLFNEFGANLADKFDLTAEEIDSIELATSITGKLDILPPGYMLTKHYMSVDQTLYTEMEQKLSDFTHTMQNTYGLQVEFVKKPVSYFKSALNSTVNATEKADLTLVGKGNAGAYDYLMSNEQYIYWNLYASTGRVSSKLPSNAGQAFWNFCKILGDNGDFSTLFGEGDDERVRTIILDAMELSADSTDYEAFQKAKTWLEGVNKFLAVPGVKEAFSKGWGFLGEVLPSTFELIYESYQWEFYQAVFKGNLYDMEGFIIGKWKYVFQEERFESTQVFEETKASRALHSFFSTDGFEEVWKGIGVSRDIASRFTEAAIYAGSDVSLFLAAQDSLDTCNLFVDSIINHTPATTEDARKVIDCAKSIKKVINEANPLESFVSKIATDAFWDSLNTLGGAAVDKATALARSGANVSGVVTIVKGALKIITVVGDSIFNVTERYGIADNIRFVSVLSAGMGSAIEAARSKYTSDKSEAHARDYMQLISYMLNLRAIGESQTASLGMTYEVIPGVFDSRDFFISVRDLTGAAETKSWIQWRDFVEDKISLTRVQLLKNPLSVDASSFTAPIVSFDYLKEETIQSFSSDYEYSLDNGKTWTVCSGSPIGVTLQFYPVTLQVRRVDFSNTTERMVGSVIVWPPFSLGDSGIRVRQTAHGYRLEGLNAEKQYELALTAEPSAYEYGEVLPIAVPKGVTSYEYATSSTFGFAYLRSVTDTQGRASYTEAVPLHKMVNVAVDSDNGGTIVGAGAYEYGSEVVLSAVRAEGYAFEGWYEEGRLVSADETISFLADKDRKLHAVFKLDESWSLDPVKGFVTGIAENTSVDQVIAHYEKLGQTVEVLGSDGGRPVGALGTGCVLLVDGTSYQVVISGDVDGDGAVSIFDMFLLMGHVNSDKALSGVFFEAGRMCGGEDITIFDVYQSRDRVNSDSLEG